LRGQSRVFAIAPARLAGAELIGIAKGVVESAQHSMRDTQKIRLTGPVAQVAVKEWHRQIEHNCGLGERVIDQARRRTLQGEQVPNGEKIYSIFEPHTDLIKRGKVLTPVEFGHKVFLAESAQGLITQYGVLDGNPSDEDHVEASLSRHQAMFGSAPQLDSSDRGFFSEENLATCQRSGVEMASIPQRGGTKSAEREAREKSPAFKKAQRFRAGIEGRISVLFRGRGMKRCLAEGRERFELLVGAAVLANNLLTIASLMQKRSAGRRRAA
jgi:IS5 family transposase